METLPAAITARCTEKKVAGMPLLLSNVDSIHVLTSLRSLYIPKLLCFTSIRMCCALQTVSNVISVVPQSMKLELIAWIGKYSRNHRVSPCCRHLTIFVLQSICMFESADQVSTFSHGIADWVPCICTRFDHGNSQGIYHDG